MSKGKILVVEDEAIEALDIESRLARLGYEPSGRAATGAEAVALAQSAEPDLVLMDVALPGDMDGVEAARRIREESDVPIIYMTARRDPATLERAKKTAPAGYLCKPFADHELSLTMEMALYKRQAEQRLRRSERLLSATLGSLGEAVISFDTDGRATYLNPAAERMLGVERAAALGRRYDALFSVLDAATRQPMKKVATLCAPSPGHPACTELLLATPDGRKTQVALSLTPLLSAKGVLRGRVLVLRDVTLRKHAEAELRRSMAELHTALRQTVRALASMAEKRDPYTAGHQQRVARLAYAIGLEMGLPPDALEGLEMAALLHDIGKVCVPAEILAKPGRLSRLEMGIVQTHPEVGYEILREVSFPWPVAQAVLEHHERMDGSGYPAGLHGRAICREARIVAVADVVEAMSSHRPYRAALGLDEALKEIETGRGRLYDPEVADICLRLFRSGGFTFDEPTTAEPAPTTPEAPPDVATPGAATEAEKP